MLSMLSHNKSLNSSSGKDCNNSIVRSVLCHCLNAISSSSSWSINSCTKKCFNASIPGHWLHRCKIHSAFSREPTINAMKSL